MLGFFVGTACLIGLIAMIRRDRWHGRRWGGGFGPRRFLNRVFERIDTSPSQEKEIVAAVEQIVAAGRAARPEFEATRHDVARILQEENFDPERVAAVFARHDEQLKKMRDAATAGLAKVHATLDPQQRARLAQMIEERAFGFRRRHHGPYREAVQV